MSNQGKLPPAKAWLGREGDGALVRGGLSRMRYNAWNAGGRWHAELRGWVFTKAQYQSFRLTYTGAVEELSWADFELAEWQGYNSVTVGPKVRSGQGVREGFRRRAGGSVA